MINFGEIIENLKANGKEDVATLAFGSRPRQGGCKVAGLIVDPGVTSHAPGNAKSVRE
jgi:hypothetical protein